MDARLRDVEITFGKVDQRLLTIERDLPSPAASRQRQLLPNQYPRLAAPTGRVMMWWWAHGLPRPKRCRRGGATYSRGVVNRCARPFVAADLAADLATTLGRSRALARPLDSDQAAEPAGGRHAEVAASRVSVMTCHRVVVCPPQMSSPRAHRTRGRCRAPPAEETPRSRIP